MNAQSKPLPQIPLKAYLAPALCALCLVLGSLWWGAGEEHAALEREQKQGRRHINNLSQGLRILVAQLDGDEALIASQIQESLRISPPLIFVMLARADDSIVYLGEQVDDPFEVGPRSDSRMWIMRRSLEARRDREICQGGAHTHPEERPGGPRPWQWVDCDSAMEVHHRAPLDVYVGMHTDLSPGRRIEVLARALAMLLITWLGTALLVLTWVRRIRTRVLSQAFAREQQKRRLLEDMNLAAAGLAHETRNPLGLILGFAQRLASSPDTPAEIKEVAFQIVDEADRATSRLSDFLNFASIKAPTRTRADLHEICAHIVSTLKPDFEAAGVTLTATVDACEIECDVEMLEQILINLLLNSLRASSSGSTTHITLRKESGLGTLSIMDQGEGVDPELLAHVFKPYVTGHADGHGLGLAIVARLVAQHEWRIHVESSDQGATFSITHIPILSSQVTDS